MTDERKIIDAPIYRCVVCQAEIALPIPPGADVAIVCAKCGGDLTGGAPIEPRDEYPVLRRVLGMVGALMGRDPLSPFRAMAREYDAQGRAVDDLLHRRGRERPADTGTAPPGVRVGPIAVAEIDNATGRARAAMREAFRPVEVLLPGQFAPVPPEWSEYELGRIIREPIIVPPMRPSTTLLDDLRAAQMRDNAPRHRHKGGKRRRRLRPPRR